MGHGYFQQAAKPRTIHRSNVVAVVPRVRSAMYSPNGCTEAKNACCFPRPEMQASFTEILGTQICNPALKEKNAIQSALKLAAVTPTGRSVCPLRPSNWPATGTRKRDGRELRWSGLWDKTRTGRTPACQVERDGRNGCREGNMCW